MTVNGCCGRESGPLHDRFDGAIVTATELSRALPEPNDCYVAEAIYQAAIARWPMARVTLRQGIRWCMTTRTNKAANEAVP